MRRAVNLCAFVVALAGTNLKASLALRGAFWLQATFMLLNNVTFFTMWLIFFDRFEQVGGWQLHDVTVVFGVVAGGFGLAAVLAGGVPVLAKAIVEGELDPLLVQPKSALVQSAASRSTASGWGDLATGVGFLAIGGRSDVGILLTAPLAIVASGAAFAGMGILFQSLAFWLGRVETLARQLAEFTLTFSLYPRPLFGGALRVLLFTAVPAGFVGWLPVNAVREPGAATTALALVGAGGLFALAAVVFERGLRQYESGNRFGLRG